MAKPKTKTPAMQTPQDCVLKEVNGFRFHRAKYHPARGAYLSGDGIGSPTFRLTGFKRSGRPVVLSPNGVKYIVEM